MQQGIRSICEPLRAPRREERPLEQAPVMLQQASAYHCYDVAMKEMAKFGTALGKWEIQNSDILSKSGG